MGRGELRVARGGKRSGERRASSVPVQGIEREGGHHGSHMPMASAVAPISARRHADLETLQMRIMDRARSKEVDDAMLQIDALAAATKR